MPTGLSGATAATTSLDIPADVGTVGWWDGHWVSPTGLRTEAVPQPGEPGAAVLAGHVDSATAGPGALYHLDRLRTGDEIAVRGTNGVVSRWTVSQAPLVRSKGDLPATLWVNDGASPTGGYHLGRSVRLGHRPLPRQCDRLGRTLALNGPGCGRHSRPPATHHTATTS